VVILAGRPPATGRPELTTRRDTPVVPETIFGLPVHPLIVHATVVFVPTAALLLLLSALVPRFRRWAGPLTPAVALVALVLVPMTTSSGENLESQVGANPLIQQHSEYADMLLPWMISVAVLAVAVWWYDRRTRGSLQGPRTPKALGAVLAGLAVIAFAGTTIQIVLIGHSGAEAAWHGVANQSSSTQGESGGS
jgi:glucan phosphoethanolaminetransferase (alkaline phosphatase superfamily)